MSTVPSLPMSSWSTARKVAAGTFALAAFTALSFAAVYASGVVFLLLNKTDPRIAGFTSIVTYWEAYADDARLRQKLVMSVVVSGLGLMVGVPGALFAASRSRRPLHGEARFANAAEVARAGLIAGEPRGPRILIGRYNGMFLALPGQLSVMLSAPTRSGKGVGVVVPNLLNWPDSAVVLDIKGENYDITAGFRAHHQQKVFAFSPFNEDARSHRWNPLSTVRTSPLHRIGDLLTIGQVFFPNDGSGTSSEAFFNDQARNLFLGLGLVLLESPEWSRTIGELLRLSSGRGQSLKTYLNGLIEMRRKAHRPFTDECIDALQRLLSNSENTLTSIVATLNAPLTIFADAVVDAATSGDDFQLEDVRRERMSIYVRIPPNRLSSARPLLNLFFSQLVSLNTQQLPTQDPTLKLQCLLVNDEFAAMGRIGAISTAAAFLAGYNLRLLTVVQAMSQLDAVYGDKEARTFATNHGLQILFAPREQRDADEYSAMLGQFTERATSRGHSRSFSTHGSSSVSRNESDQRRALLLPQEFKELGSERLVVIFENCKPILAEKIRYYREKEFTSRLRKPPVVPRMDMDLHMARVQQRWRYAPDVLATSQGLDVDVLAHNLDALPVLVADPGKCADAMLDFFSQVGPGAKASTGSGGTIEALVDDDAGDDPGVTATADEDGVLSVSTTPPEPPSVAPELDLSRLEPTTGGPPCAQSSD